MNHPENPHGFPADVPAFSIPRRRFLQQAAAAGIGATLAGRFAFGETEGETFKRVNTAVIGVNSRGGALISYLLGSKMADISYICDVDSRAVEKGITEASKGGNPPKGEKDFRKMLADPAVEAVVIATPDHWHAPMAILALAAGKHVYVEKPCSQTAGEAEMLAAAAKKYGKVVQMGNQRRSFPNMIHAVKRIHDGAIGKAYFARAWYVNARKPIGQGKPAPVPDWLDYDLWQGPAPRHAYADNLIHYNWHWFWRYGTGELGNNGTHELDVCRWALDAAYPEKVVSSGGRYAFQDDWETPDTQTVSWNFPGGKMMAWEGRSCNDFPDEKVGRGAMIYGTEGSALVEGNNYTFFDKKKQPFEHNQDVTASDAANTLSSTDARLDTKHMVNFLAAVRGKEAANSPADVAATTIMLVHLGNIALRTGRTLNCDPANGHIQNDPDAMKLWNREYEPGWEPKV